MPYGKGYCPDPHPPPPTLRVRQPRPTPVVQNHPPEEADDHTQSEHAHSCVQAGHKEGQLNDCLNVLSLQADTRMRVHACKLERWARHWCCLQASHKAGQLNDCLDALSLQHSHRDKRYMGMHALG